MLVDRGYESAPATNEPYQSTPYITCPPSPCLPLSVILIIDG
jgi:hypothetical protein